MKIVHVITAFGIGGAEKLLLNVVNRQVISHEVHLIYLKPINDLVSEVDSRVFVKHIPVSFSTIKDLSIYYHKVKADVIHTHLGHADIMGIWAAKKTKAKLFSTIHSTSFKGNSALDNLYFSFYRFLFKRFNDRWNLISISKSVEQIVIKKITRVNQNNYVLHNAIPDVGYFDRAHNKIVSILFVGRLTKAKSIDTLLKAVCHLKKKNKDLNFRVTIVGEGHLKRKLLKLTHKLKVEDIVTFTGKRKNVNEFYKKSDIFILPSIWEGFGIVILEAFSAKLAVIASAIEGPEELIQDNINGLLFNPQNFIQLAEKMELLIENKTLRESLAKEGYNTFTEDFHIESYVKKLEELYLNV